MACGNEVCICKEVDALRNVIDALKEVESSGSPREVYVNKFLKTIADLAKLREDVFRKIAEDPDIYIAFREEVSAEHVAEYLNKRSEGVFRIKQALGKSRRKLFYLDTKADVTQVIEVLSMILSELFNCSEVGEVLMKLYEGGNVKEPVKCPKCRSTKFKVVLVEGRYALLKCMNCGTYFRKKYSEVKEEVSS